MSKIKSGNIISVYYKSSNHTLFGLVQDDNVYFFGFYNKHEVWESYNSWDKICANQENINNIYKIKSTSNYMRILKEFFKHGPSDAMNLACNYFDSRIIVRNYKNEYIPQNGDIIIFTPELKVCYGFYMDEQIIVYGRENTSKSIVKEYSNSYKFDKIKDEIMHVYRTTTNNFDAVADVISKRTHRSNFQHLYVDKEKLEQIEIPTKPHTIIIDDKEIEISAESYQALKESLIKE